MDKLTTQIESLKKTVGILNVNELSEVSAAAVKNLKDQITDPNSAFANDPELMLEAVKVINKVSTDTIEAQRRVIDTLIRYNSQMERPVTPADNLLPPVDEPEAPEIAAPAKSTFE